MNASGDILLAAIREAILSPVAPWSRGISGSCGRRWAAPPAWSVRPRWRPTELFATEMLQDWITLGTPRRLPDLLDLANAARSRSRADAPAWPPAPR